MAAAKSDKSPEGASRTVHDFYAKLAVGNFPEAFAYVSPDAVIREPAELPFAGDYKGQAAHGELLQRIGAVVDLSILQHEVLDSGETFAVKLRSRFTPRAGGEAIDLDIIELITVAEGKIVEIDVYHKTPSAVTQLWPE